MPWWIALVVLAIATIATVWYPLIRTFAHFEINVNEGWNAYRAKTAASGLPLYGAAPRYTGTNYPPLSFHFIGWIGHFNGGFVAAGRYVSLVSVVLIGVLIAALVRRFTASGLAAGYAAFSFVIWLAIFLPDRIGMDDPQLFATVFSLVGLYAYVVRPDSGRWLGVSAVGFALSLFTKHNLLAFPLAVGVHLLLTGSFKRFAIWAGAFGAAAGTFLLITVYVDGPYFLAHLTAARPYALTFFIPGRYFATLQIPIAAAVVWSLWNATNSSHNVLAIALVAAHVIGLGFAGGYGVDGNVFFDGLIAVVIITAVAAGDLAEVVQNRRFGDLIFTAVLLAPMAGVVPLLPARIQADRHEFSGIPILESEFSQTVNILSSRPGPALCTNLLPCFEAGKEELVDTFVILCDVKLGKLQEEEVWRLIDTTHFEAIALAEEGGSLGFRAPMESVMERIMSHYRLVLRTNRYGVLIRNGN